MGLLEQVHRGKRSAPPRLMLYGTEGIGKSTFAAQAPRAVFVPTEDGLNEIACDSLPLARSVGDVTAALSELGSEAHEYQTVVVDSLDWLERLIWDEVCREYGVKSIEKADGGYAKGYSHALVHWRQVVTQLDALRERLGMAVILIAHCRIEKFEDPEGPAYDRYSPRLHKHAVSLVTEWADAVLFATRRIVTNTEDAGFGRKRTTAAGVGQEAGGERIIRAVGGPSCVAKNRYNLPPELPLSWQALMSALTQTDEPQTQEGD